MFDSCYKFGHCGHAQRSNEMVLTDHLLTFTCNRNHQYLVHVEQYDHLVFAIKFYLKAHQLSPRRFNLMTKFNDAPRILSTILQIVKSFEEKFPLASFAFLGAEQDGESSTYNTKRFRIYKPIMENLFSVSKFDHQYTEAESFYLMLNREHDQRNKYLYPYIGQVFKNLAQKE